MFFCRPLLTVFAFLTLSSAFIKTSSGWTDATTSATTPNGKFEIRGVTGNERHMHGGPPAQLGYVRFVFVNRGDKSRRITVTDIEFLQGSKNCERPPDKVASHLKFAGILLDDGSQRESAPQVDVKPGASVGASVGFPSVPAYYVYCDRFAFRVHFRIDDEKLTVIDEINLTRVEPLRPRDP